MQETWVKSLDREDLLEKEMATHSSTFAWKIPWMEKPVRLQSMGTQKVGHEWATSLSLSSTRCVKSFLLDCCSCCNFTYAPWAFLSKANHRKVWFLQGTGGFQATLHFPDCINVTCGHTCWLKRYTTLFGQNEDCSLEDSTSDSSEKLLQRGSGERSICKILVKRQFSAIKCLLYKRFSASLETPMSPWGDLVLF